MGGSEFLCGVLMFELWALCNVCLRVFGFCTLDSFRFGCECMLCLCICYFVEMLIVDLTLLFGWSFGFGYVLFTCFVVVWLLYWFCVCG